MNEISNLRNVNSYQLDETIDINRVYFIGPKSQNPIAQKYGKDWIKDSGIKPRTIGKKKFYSWIDFLASGKLPNPGATYQIATYENGANTPVLVFIGVASSGDNLETNLSDSIDNSKAMIPTAGYNPINERTNYRTFADALQYQTNTTINLLQDELRQKDALIQELTQRPEMAQAQFYQREERMSIERDELIKRNMELTTQIESLKRELELEKLRNSIERDSREKELKLEKKLDRLENRKTDWGKTLGDLVQLSGNVPTLLNALKGGGMMPGMANATVPPDYYDDDDNEEVTNEQD